LPQPPPPPPPLFPYTTLFRSVAKQAGTTGVVNQTGGTMSVGSSSPGALKLASSAGASGTYNLQGGLLNLYGNRIETVAAGATGRSEEHTSELQSRSDLVCRLL